MNTEPDFSTQNVMENDRMVEDQNEKTISVFDFTEPVREETVKEEKTEPVGLTEPAPVPQAAKPEQAPPAPAPEADIPGEPEKTVPNTKGKKALVIILTVVIALFAVFLAIVAGPFGLIALGAIPFLFVVVWPRERKGKQ